MDKLGLTSSEVNCAFPSENPSAGSLSVCPLVCIREHDSSQTPERVASPKLSRILISLKLSYSLSVPRTLARIRISNLLYSQKATSFFRTRENNKTNVNKIIRAGSEFAKSGEKEPKGKKKAPRRSR
ncbi:hypothetical protein AVEN_224743-1 [Araneus ventricosus]|uniref:Uncharacterized protein n=1 Tax=Araneus ventricosus TaxID=182803 RepID=A0A4Y2HX53_ARAVE|nr:hypothetical protein AVEN_224743-1 [Araneus ventricosus]